MITLKMCPFVLCDVDRIAETNKDLIFCFIPGMVLNVISYIINRLEFQLVTLFYVMKC